ncbi:MAG: hypothetical protein QOG72_2417 [Sphingomonadales bacterium]|jgi:hypothetical protein|nr:hypothetical protein [Sphingomonadales bacterium]
MTLKPLDFDFSLMSDLSVRPPHSVPEEEMLAEVEQTLADRSVFYRRQVERGKMRVDEAERHIALLADVAADLRGRPAGEPAAFAWEAKVRELRREIAIRRNRWPKRIDSHVDPLDRATAARRLEQLDSVHFHYWVRFAFADDLVAGLEPPHFLASDGRRGVLRGWQWRAWAWERDALARGDPAARPAMAGFYADVAAGDAWAAGIWNHYRFCAERLGFAEPARAA